MPKNLKGIGAVHLRRGKYLLRNGIQVIHHKKGYNHRIKKPGERHRPKGIGRFKEPLVMKILIEEANQPVHKAHFIIENEAINQSPSCCGNHIRHHKNRSGEFPASRLLEQNKSKNRSEAHMKNGGNKRPQKKILHGKLKRFLPKKLYVILQSHKTGTIKAVILRKGSQENTENRL